MEYLFERVSYLKGLAEGMKIDENTNEGKLMVKIIDVLDDMAIAINELAETQDELDEYVDIIDEDLSAVEDDLYGDLDEDEDDECECDDDDEDTDFIEIECPHCKEFVYFDEEIILNSEEVTCPNCHKTIPIEVEVQSCGCGCTDCE